MFDQTLKEAFQALQERGLDAEICLCEVNSPAKARDFMEAYRKLFKGWHLYLVFPEKKKFSCEVWLCP